MNRSHHQSYLLMTHTLELLDTLFFTVYIYFCQMYSLSLLQSIRFPHYCLQQAQQFCLVPALNFFLSG